MEICDYWFEWHYSNIRTEHLSAMGLAAVILKREAELIEFFNEKIINVTKSDRPTHIQNQEISYYNKIIKYLETGIMGHFNSGEYINENTEMYSPTDNPEQLKQLEKESEGNKSKLLQKVFSRGYTEDAVNVYYKYCDEQLTAMWHYKALGLFLYLDNIEEAFLCVKRIVKSQDWCIASATQVRPMELFEHQLIHSFLAEENYRLRIMNIINNEI